MITLLLSLSSALVPAPTETLAHRYQGQFALVRGHAKGPRVAVGFREFNQYRGRLILYSLDSGGVFADVAAEIDQIDFARRVVAVGDLDGDGTDDLAVSSRLDRKPEQPGRVELRSGADGALLGRLEPDIDEVQFGESLAGAPDVDGDGHTDFLVGVGALSPLRPGASAAYVLVSGKTRERIGRITTGIATGRMTTPLVVLPGPEKHVWAAHTLGHDAVRLDLTTRVLDAEYVEDHEPATTAITALASLGDRDGDGFEELVLAETRAGKNTWVVLDGRTWKPSAVPATCAVVDASLGDLSRAPDLDGDGVADLVGCRSWSDGVLVQAFSGKTLAALGELATPPECKSFFGNQCALVARKDGALAALVSCYSPRGSEAQRGVFVWDWEKRAPARTFGRP